METVDWDQVKPTIWNIECEIGSQKWREMTDGKPSMIDWAMDKAHKEVIPFGPFDDSDRFKVESWQSKLIASFVGEMRNGGIQKIPPRPHFI